MGATFDTFVKYITNVYKDTGLTVLDTLSSELESRSFDNLKSIYKSTNTREINYSKKIY